jgi:hypothetical protein
LQEWFRLLLLNSYTTLGEVLLQPQLRTPTMVLILRDRIQETVKIRPNRIHL